MEGNFVRFLMVSGCAMIWIMVIFALIWDRVKNRELLYKAFQGFVVIQAIFVTGVLLYTVW